MLPKKKFIKKTEDFICNVCGFKIKGTGYTDHCPNCLFSKHLDLNPGDRQATCHGLMKPIGMTQKKGKQQILYRCQKCGYQRFNKVSLEDNQEKLLEISSFPIKE